MIVDGRAIAQKLQQETANAITHLPTTPHLTVFTCAPNFETQKFLKLKKTAAKAVGIDVNVIEFPEDITTDEVMQSITHASMQTDGIIVQLPFPQTVDVREVLRSIPTNLDVDGVHYDGTQTDVLPPVVGAVKAISETYDVLLAASQLVVIGEGRLVGAPVAVWAARQGAQVTIITEDTVDADEVLRQAHIIVSGAGQPGLITPDKIQDNVAIFDAGTSESAGVLRGDADPVCAEKCSLFTPVPGGVGPITISILLRNVVRLMQQQL